MPILIATLQDKSLIDYVVIYNNVNSLNYLSTLKNKTSILIAII